MATNTTTKRTTTIEYRVVHIAGATYAVIEGWPYGGEERVIATVSGRHWANLAAEAFAAACVMPAGVATTLEVED